MNDDTNLISTTPDDLRAFDDERKCVKIIETSSSKMSQEVVPDRNMVLCGDAKDTPEVIAQSDDCGLISETLVDLQLKREAARDDPILPESPSASSTDQRCPCSLVGSFM